ncbi:MAG: metallophosphoesterase [Muribaculaceae bacterium]
MRIPLIIAIIALALNIGIDAYIARSIRRVFSKARRAVKAHIIISVVAAAALAFLICLPKKEVSQAGLTVIMWALFGYLSIYAAKLTFIVCDSIGLLVRAILRRRNRAAVAAVVGCIAALSVFIALWWGALVTRYDIEVKPVSVAVSGLPDTFDGYTIAQISDLHVGSYGPDTTYVSRLVDSINALQPDIIVFTGDIVNRTTAELHPFVAPLSRLQAPDGVLSILGNHDYGDYYEWDSPQDKTDNMRLMHQLQQQMRWHLLDNETIMLHRGSDSLAVIGVQNVGDPPFPIYGSLSKAYPAISDAAVKVLLSHNPVHWTDSISNRPEVNVALTLSGHTHAMQIACGRFSPAALRYKTWGGLYTDSLGRALYVNIGIGEVAFPARVGATPEITLITLHKK